MSNNEEAIRVDPGPPPQIRLVGEVDFRSADLLRTVLRDNTREGVDLRIDLAGLVYMDSRGYAVLVDAARRLISGGGRLVLESPPPSVTHTLRLTGLRSYFTIHPSHTSEEERTPPPATSGGWQHADFDIPCRVNLLGMARERIMSMARTIPFTGDELYETELAVGEALSNALRHGCKEVDHVISVECETNGSSLTVCITDPGGGFKPADVPAPRMEALQEGGMGLHFMQLMMDDVKYDFDERGTTVTLLKIPKHAATDAA